MKKLTEAWLNAAQDDLDVIERIIEVEHLSHIVAFHAQQCIEKSFKAVLEEHSQEAKKTHSLGNLYSKVNMLLPIELETEILKILDSIYLEARYPSNLGLLPEGRPHQTDALEFQRFARSTHQRIKNLLS